MTDPALASTNGQFQAVLLRSPAMRIEGGSDESRRNIIAEPVPDPGPGSHGDIRGDRNIPFNGIE